MNFCSDTITRGFFQKYIFGLGYIGLTRNKKNGILALKIFFSNTLFKDFYSKIIDIHKLIHWLQYRKIYHFSEKKEKSDRWALFMEKIDFKTHGI